MDENPIYERIQTRLKALGLSERQASLASVGNAELLRNIRRGKSLSPRGGSLTKLARVLKVSETWLLTGEGEPDFDLQPAETGVAYGGTVEAGAFRPWDTLNQTSEHRRIPVTPDPRYPREAQFAFEVVGDSMDEANILPGMWVLAVDAHVWEKLNSEVAGDGKIVVAARTRDSRPERELTVKQLRVFHDRLELRPRSSNPRHETLVKPWPPEEHPAEEITVIAIVLQAVWLF